MKRSEAVDNIACVLVANAPYTQAIDIMKIAEIAELIMQDIETRTGMLPPTTCRPVVIGIDGKTGEVAALDISSEPKNGWEPENETK